MPVVYYAGYVVGVVHPEDMLAGLKVYAIPHLALFDPAWVPVLERFVNDGDTLIIGAHTGCKDRQTTWSRRRCRGRCADWWVDV